MQLTYVCCTTYPTVSSDVRCVCTYVSAFFLSACMQFVLDKNSTTFITAHWTFISSADNVSSAELMVLLIVRRPSSVVVRRPSVNFCFKSLLLLQFLFNNSEFFTGETRHIVPPCNKAGISNFCLEFQKLQKFQISWKRYSSYSSYSIILNFFTGETRHIVPPCNKAGISNFCLEFQKLQKFQIAEIPVKTALLISSYSMILKFYWRN